MCLCVKKKFRYRVLNRLFLDMNFEKIKKLQKKDIFFLKSPCATS